MSKHDVLKRAYTWLVGLAGIAILAINVPQIEGTNRVLEILFLGLLVWLGESGQVSMPHGKGTISVSSPLLYTTNVLFGQKVGVWVSALATLRKKDLKGEVPLNVVLFNRGMLSISALAFSRVYSAFRNLSFSRDFVAFIAGAFAYTFTNAAIIAVAIALQNGMSLAGVWGMHIRWGVPNMLALFPLGFLMVMVAQQGSPWFLLLFFMPLMVTKYSLQKYTEMREVYQELAGALSNAIDVRDSYTRGHSERVAEYASLLAKELGFPEDQIETIWYVGLLHDIGKVGIPDEVMKKPGAYTYEEYQEMKRHSALGADMLEGMRLLGQGQNWIRYHCERWDGTGFPEGLKGDEIPLEARIIACADSFDAMTTDRPYKKKMTIAQAKEELVRCSGSQFDPKIVEAMLKVIDKQGLKED